MTEVLSLRRRPLSLARISARDRRRSAIHEAGHAVIACELGAINVQAVIWEIETADPINDKTWRGQTGGVHIVAGMSGPEKEMVAVAGAVAEHCWDVRRDLEDWGFDLFDIEAVMSETDMKLVGCEKLNDIFSYPDETEERLLDAAARAYALLNPFYGRLWPRLNEVARVLMRDGCWSLEWEVWERQPKDNS